MNVAGTPPERARAIADLACQLKVSPVRDQPALLVDAQAIMSSDSDVRFWQLDVDGDGLWHHWPSGSEGPLADCLLSIAAVYHERRRTIDPAELNAVRVVQVQPCPADPCDLLEHHDGPHIFFEMDE